MNARSRVPALIAGLLAVNLATACGGGSTGKAAGATQGGGSGSGTSSGAGGATGGGKGAAPSPAKPRVSYDPPTAFASPDGASVPVAALAGKITLGGDILARPAIALKGQVGYVGALDSITAVDLTTSKTLGTVTAKYPLGQQSIDLYSASSNSAPLLTTVGGRTLAIGAFATVKPSSGTTANQASVELAAMDTANQTSAFDISLDAPDWASDPSYLNKLTANAMAVSGGTALVQLSGGGHNLLYAVDLASQKVLWSKDGYSFIQAGDSQLVASAPQPERPEFESRLVALDTAAGSQRWEMDHLSSVRAHAAGPHLIALFAFADWNGSGSVAKMKNGSGMLNADTGKMISVDNGIVQPFQSIACQYDERSVVICADGHGTDNVMSAYDAVSGKPLWNLPDTNTHRVAPVFHTVWHGLVYGIVIDNDHKTHPVLLDARTGADRPTTATMSPLLVNNYFGLMLDTDGKTLVAYGATA